jgi:hypothetical protein
MRKPNLNRRPTFKVSNKKDVPLIKWLDVFMERYGMSYKEFLELPIPTFYALAEIIAEEAKESRKNLKNG